MIACSASQSKNVNVPASNGPNRFMNSNNPPIQAPNGAPNAPAPNGVGVVKAAQFHFQQQQQQLQQQSFIPSAGNNYAANLRNSRQAQKYIMNSVANYYEAMAYNGGSPLVK